MTFAPGASPQDPNQGATQSGDVCGVSGEKGLAALDPFVYRDMRWCARCAGEQLFVPMFECDFGRVGVCMGCGEEKVQRFTRTTEVAA